MTAPNSICHLFTLHTVFHEPSKLLWFFFFSISLWQKKNPRPNCRTWQRTLRKRSRKSRKRRQIFRAPALASRKHLSSLLHLETRIQRLPWPAIRRWVPLTSQQTASWMWVPHSVMFWLNCLMSIKCVLCQYIASSFATIVSMFNAQIDNEKHDYEVLAYSKMNVNSQLYWKDFIYSFQFLK